jgi:hypothetical protein
MKNAGGARSEPKTKTLAADMAVQEKRGAAAAPLPVGTWSKGNEQGAGLDGLVPKFPKSSSTTDCNPASDPPPRRRLSSERRLRWAELLKRVFELDALRCPVYALHQYMRPIFPTSVHWASWLAAQHSGHAPWRAFRMG